MEPNARLNEFMQPYSSKVRETALLLRKLIVDLVPEANELIWDNYNALAIAYSKSEKLKDAFCHIALYSKHVNLGFNRGAELVSPNLKLHGSGKLIRHIKVPNFEEVPLRIVKDLIIDAVSLADSLNPVLIEKTSKGKSVVMSVSEKKVRPNQN